jgi:hypothetical protein
MSARTSDHGLASARTVLAWGRSAISSIAVAALVLRDGIVSGPLRLAVPVAALLLAAALFEWHFSVRLHLEHDRSYKRGAVRHDLAIGFLGVVTTIAAAGAAAPAIVR